MGLLLSIVGFLAAVTLLVFVHEWGHYAVARRCGVKVLRFSIGFGRPLLRWRGRDGVEWVVSAIPLGGYVRMLDERDPSCEVAPGERAQAFNQRPVVQKMAIVLAGPAANFVAAAVLLAIMAWVGMEEPKPILDQPLAGTPAYQAGVQRGDEVIQLNGAPVQGYGGLRRELLSVVLDGETAHLTLRQRNGMLREVNLAQGGEPRDWTQGDPLAALGFRLLPRAIRVSKVSADGAAAAGGLQVRDQILALDGVGIDQTDQVSQMVRSAIGRPVEVVVLRGERRLQLTLVPKAVVDDQGVAVGRLGIGLAPEFDRTLVSYGWMDGAFQGLSQAWTACWMTLKVVGQMVTGQVSLKAVAGPGAMADAAGQSLSLGWMAYVAFLASISINLAVLNLLPVPILDGGHFMYHLVEAVRGRPVSVEAMAFGQRIGMTLILALTALALFNDVMR